MSAPSIPGYYHDDSKKKYFKIQPHHVAPIGVKYSEQSVKREAEDQVVRKRHKSHDQRRLQTRIDRPRLRSHLIGGGAGLERELGGGFDGRSAGIGTWAQGLERRTVIASRASSALFAHDDATGGLIIGRAFVGGALGERQDGLAWVLYPIFLWCSVLCRSLGG